MSNFCIGDYFLALIIVIHGYGYGEMSYQFVAARSKFAHAASIVLRCTSRLTQADYDHRGSVKRAFSVSRLILSLVDGSFDVNRRFYGSPSADSGRIGTAELSVVNLMRVQLSRRIVDGLIPQNHDVSKPHARRRLRPTRECDLNKCDGRLRSCTQRFIEDCRLMICCGRF